MTHIYDVDIKLMGGILGYNFYITKPFTNEMTGETLMTIDIQEHGVLLSRKDYVNLKAVALAETYCEILRKEMLDVLSLTDEQMEQWAELASEYQSINIEHPLEEAYREVKLLLSNKFKVDIDKDRDVC
jgi:hypothetical protein